MPVIIVITAFVGAGCSDGDAGRWRLVDIDDPADVLASVEAKWHAEVEHRGSIMHDDARCYFQLDPASDNDVLDTLVACGPVSHWRGMVGPTPTPTAHERRGDYDVPLFDPETFRQPYAGSGRWDFYRFESIHRLDDDRSKVTAVGPMASSHGRRTLRPEEIDRFVRPDGLQPPDDRGADLPTPTPPDDAVIPLDKVIDVDVDEEYRPGEYADGDLAVTYDLDITDGTWEASYEGNRKLTLDIEANIEATEGYRLNYDPGDSATADPDTGDEASSITEGAITTYEIDPGSSDHPPLVFHLPEDTTTATIELEPEVKYTATDDGFGLDPRAGLLELPTERFTVRLFSDEQAAAAEPK